MTLPEALKTQLFYVKIAFHGRFIDCTVLNQALTSEKQNDGGVKFIWAG